MSGPEALAGERVAQVDPVSSRAHFELGLAALDKGDLRAAALAFRAAARLDPANHDAVQNAIEALGLAVDRDLPPLFAAPAAAVSGPRGAVSVVVCSIDPRRLDAMQRSYRSALGAREHEFVVIRDARSLCEGYQRGLEAARHATVVFSHDDVTLASANAFEALDRALAIHDVVGVVGSRLASGPAFSWAGQPHLRGCVGYPPARAGAGWKATVYSLETGTVGGIQVLDGLMFAARREAALAIGFDARTFDGFHFYDLDFSYRAYLAGLRLAVTTELVAIHASEGGFDDTWRRYAARFQAKFPALSAPMGQAFYFGREFASEERLARFYAELNGLGAFA